MSPAHKGAILSLLSALGSAIFFVPFKIAGTMIERDVAVMATLLLAAILNTATAPLRLGRSLLDRTILISSIGFGILTAAGNYATSESLRYLGAGVTSVLQQTQVLLVAAGGWLLMGERISARFALGTGVVLGGLVVMNAPATDTAALSTQGLLWGLTSSLCFAIIHVLTRWMIDRIDPIPVNALRLWTAALCLAVLPGNIVTLAHMDASPWLLCVAAAFVGPFLARIALMYAVRYVSASHSILITLVTPVFAFAFDFLFLGRTPNIYELIGGAMTIVGVAVPMLELAGSPMPPRQG